MGDRLAAAGVQLRRAAARGGRGSLLGHQGAGPRAGALRDEPEYEDIEMPRNSPTGFVCAFFATVMGFALIWHIWWMAASGCVGAFATFVVFAWRDQAEYDDPGRRGRRASTAATAGPRRASHRMAHADRGVSAHAIGGRPARLGHGATGRAPAPTEHGARRPRLQADRRRLRLLDLPAQRHHHVRGLLRRLRGAVGRDGGRPGGQELFDLATWRSRRRACCCPPSPAAWPASAAARKHGLFYSRAWRSPSCSGPPSSASS